MTCVARLILNGWSKVFFRIGPAYLSDSQDGAAKDRFDRILTAWNGSRELGRDVAEAMPFLHRAN